MAFVVWTAGATAKADSITAIAANVSPTPVFFATPTPQWDIPAGPLTSGTVVGGSKTWFIAPTFLGSPPGTLNWVSNLQTDLDPSGPIADGLFSPGGSLSINGNVYDLAVSSTTPIFSGVLLTATVSGFEIKETSSNKNQINLEGLATVHPTGGFLVSNGAGLNLVGDYYINAIGANAQQDGGDVSNFQSDIFAVQSFQFTLVQVPEPASMLLLSGLVGGLLARRRRRSN